MSWFVPVNEIESNQNVILPFDDVEKGINILAPNISSGHNQKGIIKALLYFIRSLKNRKLREQQLKEGILLMKLGDSYLVAKNFERAIDSYEKSLPLLESSKSLHRSVKSRLDSLY